MGQARPGGYGDDIGFTRVLIVPLTAAIGTIVANVDEIAEWTKTLTALKTPSPPEWVARLPLVGAKAAELWHYVAAEGIQDIGPPGGALRR